MPDPFSSDTISDETQDDITLDTLVGEGRKYRDANELAKAYAAADAYISRSKEERVTLDAELKVLKDIAEARNKVDPKDDTPPRHEPPAQETPKTPDIAELVRQEIAATSSEQRKTDNINRAAAVMNDHFGSAAKAQDAMRRRASELGVSFEWLREAASNSPQAFFATMGISPTPQRQPNSPGYSPEVQRQSNPTGAANFKYFEELRKSDPKRYYAAETQKQLFAARRELGEKFYS